MLRISVGAVVGVFRVVGGRLAGVEAAGVVGVIESAEVNQPVVGTKGEDGGEVDAGQVVEGRSVAIPNWVEQGVVG